MTAGTRPRLLVVDDQPMNIRVLHSIFGQDHEVIMATSGAQALEICQRQIPDLVLLDVSMPDIDGFEVCQKMKENPDLSDIPVIFVTAADTQEDESRGFAVGAVDFITKPVNPVVVRARVQTHLTLKRQSDLLRNLAYVDGLTGVANRRRFDDVLAREWRVCARAAEQLAVAIVDVDHFKSFNDRYGHQSGDDCLRRIAHALQSGLRRPRDVLARYGGEEFACIVPAANPSEIYHYFDALRQRVMGLGIPHQGVPESELVTVSIGFHCVVPDASTQAKALVSDADHWLYEAKRLGRNRSIGDPIYMGPEASGS